MPADALGTDPDLLATVAVRVGAALGPAPVLVPPWSWSGTARTAADGALDRVLAAHRTAAAVLGDLGAALGAAAVSLRRVADLERAAFRVLVVGGDPAVVDRLRADAAAERTATDRALAGRLRALEDGRAGGSLAIGTDPESAWLGRPLAAVPADLVPEVAALDPGLVAADPRAPVALRETAATVLADPRVQAPGRRFLLAGDGTAAEVWGDVATAATVVVLVPGTGTSLDAFGEAHDHGQALADALGAGAAVVVWMGSPFPATLLAASLQSYAKAAAPRLSAFVEGLKLRPDQRLTLVGHSYGGVVAGLAVHGGLRPAALLGVAPAGFGPTVRSTADLGGVPTYVLQDARDPIRDVHVLETVLGDVVGPVAERVAGAVGVGHLGDDPVRLPGAVQLPSPGDRSPLLPVGFSAAVHGEYFDPGSAGLAEIVAIADPSRTFR